MTKDKEALTITKGLATGMSDYINSFEVYLIDLEGHGKCTPLKEKLFIASAAKDVDALMKYLKLKNINAIGYIFGGIVLFQPG